MQKRQALHYGSRKACAARMAVWSIIFLAALACRAADRVEFVTGEPFEGSFMGYERGRFAFRSTEGVMGEIGTRGLRRILLAEPVPVYLELHGQRQPVDTRFLGYDGGLAHFEWEDDVERVPLRRIRRVQVSFRSERVMESTDVSRLISSGEEVDIHAHLEQGHPSIVHFHDRRYAHSVRMTDYLSRFVVMSKGRIHYLKIELNGLSAPVARQYELRALPAIWFFDARGREVQRLGGAMTTREVDEAVVRADRGARND